MERTFFVALQPSDFRYLKRIRSWMHKDNPFKTDETELNPDLAEQPESESYQQSEHIIRVSSTIDKVVLLPNGRFNRPKIERRLRKSQFVLILLGENTERHPWVYFESFAAQRRLPRFFIRIPYTNSPIPENLKHIKQIAFNPNAIEKLFRIYDENGIRALHSYGFELHEKTNLDDTSPNETTANNHQNEVIN
ncbi:MAG: hypothetical protein IPI59_13220 [Sphingobacteriales bacterium]|nr:hypothetical protein [Sphingobacteriales bacterium]MBP9140243.1 hypothetical protein [Chitinophagales bacterium]MBK6889018.1 hypothetical protein [Sphingobacteriales bacterium]MBK7528478.1 hypothetical protein [Sphingobacteriales bacterium]MBK8679557.1 hypothetical protein [Sphingobacteriales bacterium]